MFVRPFKTEFLRTWNKNDLSYNKTICYQKYLLMSKVKHPSDKTKQKGDLYML